MTDETRFEILVVLLIVVVPVLMFTLNHYFMGGKNNGNDTKSKEKTVIVIEAKQGDTSQKTSSKSVVDSVRDAIKKGNYTTAYMQIKNVSKNAPEYEELRKQLAEETERRKTPGVRKEVGTVPTAPIRYLDESTPRDRSTDSIYIYFVDVSGVIVPHFCIQVISKRKLGVTGFTITVDNKKIEIIASPVKLENNVKGVAEWYDVPLDRFSYEAVEAMIKAKSGTLTVSGSNGSRTRNVTASEIKGFSNILAGYTALGGNLNYFQTANQPPSTSRAKRK